uniref:Si:dkey-184p18.2 n=1 Tax=Neolamprologus brichardi TaxID=32507 RepID=A0A3Q4GTD6_NEOBR
PPSHFVLEAGLKYDKPLIKKKNYPKVCVFHLLSEPPKQKFSSMLHNTVVCPYCCQWLHPDNHHVRLRPKQRPSARVQSVLLRKARGKRLSLVQKNLLRRFQKSSSVLMATCHACNKTSRYKGVNRDFIATCAKTHNTPGSAGKHKTPQFSSFSSSSSTSTSTTTTSGSGSGSASSKPSKIRNWVVRRLSKILQREDNQGTKKGGLKDFLSSL